MKTLDNWENERLGIPISYSAQNIAGVQMPTASEYIKVPSSDFELVQIPSSVLAVDIFYEATPNRIQKIGQKGSHFSIQFISTALIENLPWFLMRKEDYRTYVSCLLNAPYPNLSSSSISSIKKRELFIKRTQALFSEFNQRGLPSKNNEIVLNTISNVLLFVLENPIAEKLLEKIESQEQNNHHALAVAIWSQLLAQQMGWSGEPTAFCVVLCALLHDVGLNQNIDHLVGKKLSELSEHDARVVESHTIRGRDILKSIPGMPDEVITVAYQHHELVNGTGYPLKLMLDDIHPFARLVSLTNRFYEIYTKHRDTQCSLVEVFQVLKKEHAQFDLKLFKSLEDILVIQSELKPESVLD